MEPVEFTRARYRLDQIVGVSLGLLLARVDIESPPPPKEW
jgi:hypothetical protein